jgi:hypothetical protein
MNGRPRAENECDSNHPDHAGKRKGHEKHFFLLVVRLAMKAALAGDLLTPDRVVFHDAAGAIA